MQLTSVTIGSSQPRELAQFYAKLLGWPIAVLEPARAGEPAAAGWAQLRPADGETGPTINIEYERAFQRPVWPAVEGAQLASQHLDIWVDDLDEAADWAVQAGAELAAVQPQPDVRVLLDPDGHPFCLFL
ncbi:glyoxalase [Psychromicrobium lacuslunae]|uniref:Glyoxalase n=1 Tax=Psychromicrobium lacuslunae TaxID=1618207 RepID=A0A0D4C3Q8_9MICC|nr:glyoxalase [Psychromicrobium lacuslunae]